jgi:hypothetical protein
MTADEFVKIIRNGSEKLRVDEIVINTGSQQLHGKGMIRISRERVELDVTINEGEMLPEFHTGIYLRAGQKITDRITSAAKLTKTFHAPFTDRLAFNAQTGSLKWDFQDAIRKAATFFEKDSIFSKEVSIILFLFREADEGVHSEITTITLCALFENLVRLLFRELNLKEKVDNEDLKLFEEAKAEIAGQINRQIAEKGEGYRRLYNVVQSAQLFSMEQMCQAVANHFGLKWQDDMENIFKTWKRARNPLLHEKARAEMSEDEQKASVINESRIAGAINILLLKLFGYSGQMRHSTFEDGYREI